MKTLVFNDSRQIEVQSITENAGVLHVRMILTTAEQIKALFGDRFATTKMTIFENSRIAGTYENYTEFKYVKEEIGGIYEVEMCQKEADVVTRLSRLEETTGEQKKEIETLKEVQQGVIGELQAAAMVVTRFQAQVLPDKEALKAKVIYQTFDELVEKSYTAKEKGYKFRNGEELYKTAQDNVTFQAQYRPGPGTESLYTCINEAHAGTLEDPIPWKTNMQPELNKYYKEGELIAKCIEDPGQALHNELCELCPGRYFESA